MSYVRELSLPTMPIRRLTLSLLSRSFMVMMMIYMWNKLLILQVKLLLFDQQTLAAQTLCWSRTNSRQKFFQFGSEEVAWSRSYIVSAAHKSSGDNLNLKQKRLLSRNHGAKLNSWQVTKKFKSKQPWLLVGEALKMVKSLVSQ